MITEIEIENFQSHKHTELKLVSGTNVIIGASDTGKSAVFRAILWVVTNRPLGEGFRSDWGGPTRVVLHTDDGHIIERVRTDSENLYVVNGEKLAAFGTDVPELVTRLLRIDSANIQAQMDPPFLLSSSPGEVAQLLNKAASIDDIDTTIAALKKEYTSTERTVEKHEQMVDRFKEQLIPFDNIPVLEQLLDSADALAANVDKEVMETQRLADLKSTCVALNKRVQQVTRPVDPVILLDAADRAARDLVAAQQDVDALMQHITNIQSLQKQLARLSRPVDPTPLLTAVEKLAVERKKMTDYTTALLSTITQVKNAQRALGTTDRLIAQHEGEFQAIAPESCPLCGGAMHAATTTC